MAPHSSTLAWKIPWMVPVHGVAKSRARLSNFTFTFHFHALEKEVAIHSSVLAWRIPGTGEPGGLPSMGSHRVRHDWSELAAAAAVASWWKMYALGDLKGSCLLQKYFFRIIWGQKKDITLRQKEKPQFFFFFLIPRWSPEWPLEQTQDLGHCSPSRVSSSCHRLFPRLHTIKNLLLCVRFKLQNKWNNLTQNLPGGLEGLGRGRIEFFLGVTQKTEPCKTLVGEFPAMTQCLEVVGWRISSRKPFTATS